MTFVTVFLLSMLCSVYNCNYEHPTPTAKPGSIRTGRMSRLEPRDMVVVTKSGAVEGYLMTVASGRHIVAFEGIPFAQPPVGYLRFRLPWNENDNNSTGQTRLPVIVWIHGGSFFAGAGKDYGPSYLLKHDVILVTVNYRLGVMGFMSTGDEASPGNYGLKDQALAIKWVHDNIEAFGGDTSRISLMGQSAGACAVHLQMMSERSLAKGLFNTAASLSSSAFSHWCVQTQEQARKLTTKLAKILSCPTESGSQAMVDCLRSTNPSFVVSNTFHLFEIILFPVVLFAPVIESNSSADAFITDIPENYYKRNQVAKIPWLATNTEHEAEFALQALRNAALLLHYSINWRTYMPIILDLKDKTDNIEYVMDSIAENYVGNYTDPAKSNPKIWAQVATDRYFQVPNRRALLYHHSVAPTYSYMFGFSSRIGVTAALFSDHRDWGSSHSEDLSTIFNMSMYFPAIVEGERAFYMSSIMTNLISNFAAKGVPYYTTDDGNDVIIWEAIKDGNKPQFLRLNNTGDIKMVDDPFEERLKVWTKFAIK